MLDVKILGISINSCLYFRPTPGRWAALGVFLAIILLCSICGGYYMTLVIPFWYLSALGLGLACMEALRTKSRKNLNGGGVLWLLVLCIASLASFVYFFHNWSAAHGVSLWDKGGGL